MSNKLFHFHISRGRSLQGYYVPGRITYKGHGETSLSVVSKFADYLPAWEKQAYEQDLDEHLILAAVDAWHNNDWGNDALCLLGLALNLSEAELIDGVFIVHNSADYSDGAIYGDGTGYIDIDGEYNTHYVKHIEQCDEAELNAIIDGLNMYDGLYKYHSEVAAWIEQVAIDNELFEVIARLEAIKG